MKEGLGSNQFEVVQHPESKITVIGSGPTGDKAARLLEYTLLAREIGFLTPQRTVIAQDVVDSWIRAAKIGKGIESLSPEQGRAFARNERLSAAIEKVLPRVELPGVPMVVLARSSGPSDRRGIGVHESAVSLAGDHLLIGAIKRVLAGYTTEKAH